MKLLILSLFASLVPASAQTTNTYTFNWTANNPLDLVTNYVLRCVHPIDDTMVASNYGVATNATVTLSPGIWECVCLAQNFIGISDPSNMIVVGQEVQVPPEVVSGLGVNAKWHAGAFDIAGTWQLSPGAVSYNAILINLVTGTALLRTGVNRTASWLRVPASSYRLTVVAVSANGIQSSVATLEIGVLKPGKPKDFR